MRQCELRHLVKLDYSGEESLNTICSNLSFSGHNVSKIALTSCNAGEGKSFTTLQICMNFAKRGKRVVLVDADLRRSFFVRRTGMVADGDIVGLAHYLSGQAALEDILFETNVPNLSVIPIGRDVSNSVSLLDTPYFGELINRLDKIYDFVIIDTPPVGLVIDAAEIVKHCDGVVFVVECNKTHRRDLNDAKRQIEQTGTRVLGCIVNKVTFNTLASKHYYHKGYYSHYGEYSHYNKDASGKKSSSGSKK